MKTIKNQTDAGIIIAWCLLWAAVLLVLSGPVNFLLSAVNLK